MGESKKRRQTSISFIIYLSPTVLAWQYRVPGYLATSLSQAKAEEFAERAFDESQGKTPVVLWTVQVAALAVTGDRIILT